MLEVQKYLRDGHSLDALKYDYGIDAKQHKEYPNLCTLKYAQIDSHHKRSEPIVRECRGLILDKKRNWGIVAFPFKRFFNYGEGYADQIDWDSAVVQEKLDGSLSILYHYDNKWHVASSGLPDASGNVGLSDKTFKELFWDTFGSQVGWPYLTRCLMRLPKNITFMFELCSIENRVVVVHEKPKVVLLGARNIETFQEYRPGEMIHYFPGTSIPQIFPIGSTNEAFDVLKDMKGQEQEGYVVVDDNFGRIKMKCQEYAILHHLSNNLLSMRLIFENVIKRGEVDEVVAVFPAYEEMLHEARDKYENLIAELEDEYEEIKDIEDQKEFALKAVDSRLSGALFAYRAGKANSIREFVSEKVHTDKLMKVLEYK